MKDTLKEISIHYEVSPLGFSTLRTLLYFDIFSYPLTLPEIRTFSGSGIASHELLEKEITIMVKAGLIFRLGDFYSIKNDETAISRRVKGNKEAEKYIPMARRRAEFISQFPFVRAVMASGSLSKGYMDEKSDLDFFVVTAPNRLWIARTVFVLYRKMFVPFSRYKEFCTNYFLASDKLEIEEKNIFTATELATLIPLCNLDLYFKLMSDNHWMHDCLPNFRVKEDWNLNSAGETGFKALAEKIIDVLFGRQFNQFLMNVTLRRLKRKHSSRFSNSDFSLALKTKPYVSKVHLGNNQTRVLSLLQEKIKEFEARTALAFNHA